jgi:DNA-binding NtrC family response regulator
MKVLLVDDEEKFVLMLAKRLDLRGIQAKFVYTGTEAIALVEKGEHFDVAVLDVKMPGIGGIDLRRKLGEMDPRMKFVFLTGHGSDIDYTIGASEVAFYLPKPLNIDELIKTLGKVTGVSLEDTNSQR